MAKGHEEGMYPNADFVSADCDIAAPKGTGAVHSALHATLKSYAQTSENFLEVELRNS